MEQSAASRLIDLLGGNACVAAMCEVSSQAVSKWRRDGIPRARVMYLRAIRPHVFESDQVDPGSVVAVGALRKEGVSEQAGA